MRPKDIDPAAERAQHFAPRWCPRYHIKLTERFGTLGTHDVTLRDPRKSTHLNTRFFYACKYFIELLLLMIGQTEDVVADITAVKQGKKKKNKIQYFIAIRRI